MQVLKYLRVKDFFCPIPERLQRTVASDITRLNNFRIKWLCLGLVFVSLLMGAIDYHTLIPDKKDHLHSYYLWFDALLFCIGAVFLIILLYRDRFLKKNGFLTDSIVFCAWFSILVWCGAVGALEHITHHSVSTMIIGVIGLASLVYLKNRYVIFVYGASLATFILSKKTFSDMPLDFFLNHLNLIVLTLLGWVLSRILYANKLESLVNNHEMAETNLQLAKEIKIRKTAENELKLIHNELEHRVEERTRELSQLNRELHRQIEERRKIQNKLNHAEKMELIGTMASGIAHDLNNVLSGVYTYPETLLLDLPPDNHMREPLEIIRQSGRKAADIIRDMLILARRGVLAKEFLEINDIVTQFLESPEYRALCESHPQVEIKCRLADNTLGINGSRTHFSTALLNIVTNAAEAMPDGGTVFIETRQIQLKSSMQMCRVVQPGEYVKLTISDTGIGIDPKDRKRIFEPFYTNKKMGKSGTGLGMAIVWGMVKDHDGYIELNSEPGSGTVFELYFPLQHENPQKKTEQPTEKSIKGNKETILVVDDLEDQLFFAKAILERLNFTVVCAHGGEAAVDYMKQQAADLVILDMNMDPGMNGLETYKQIKKYHPGQRAVIASGFSSEQLANQARESGIKTFVKKPYSIASLSDAVRGGLDL